VGGYVWWGLELTHACFYISNEDFEKIWFTNYYPRWAIIVELI
jgi:hypothetical protein